MKKLLLLVVLLAAAPAWGQEEARPNPNDVWRAIRAGEAGYVSNPAVPNQFIKAPTGGCTEAAVGFSTPVHAQMPPIHTAQGKGLSQDALQLLMILFGFSFGAGAMVARNLGKGTA